MLKAFNKPIGDLAFVYAHSGTKTDGDNRVYAISAAILGMNKPRRNFTSNIKYDHFTERERYYSNLTKEILLNAPRLSEVKAKISQFLEDQPIILTYNNRNNIDDIIKLCGSRRIIDLSFALEYFLPHVESYSPKVLHEFITGKKREKISFSSDEIVALSIRLVEHICGRVLDDQQYARAAAIRFYLEKSNTLFGTFFSHVTRHCRQYFGGLFEPCTKPSTSNWFQYLEKSSSLKRKSEANQSAKKIKADAIKSAFDVLTSSAPAHVLRPTQIRYASCVAEAMNENKILTIEAGTGTGKTQGYLVPAMEYLRQNEDVKIAISTYTKSLQDQICRQEIPYILKYLKQYNDIPVAVLKGKSNYICAEKLANVYEESMDGKECLAWLYFVNLLFNFRSADGDAIGDKIKEYLNGNSFFRQIQNEISAKTGCLEGHINCPAQVVIAEARNARLIVTNHHKLALLDGEPVLADLFKNYIIDEASHFEQAVRQAIGRETNSWELSDIVDYLASANERISKKQGIYKYLAKMSAALGELRSAIRALNEAMKRKTHAISMEDRRIVFNDKEVSDGRLIVDYFKDLAGKIEILIGILQEVTQTDNVKRAKIDPRMATRLKTSRNQLLEYKDTIQNIIKNAALDSKVTSYQAFARHWLVVDQPVNVAEYIRENIFKRRASVIFTSATLSNEGNFEIFRKITGMQNQTKSSVNTTKDDYGFVMIESPFQTANRGIIVHTQAVKGSLANKTTWLKSMVDLLPELIIDNKGRTLVLFASYDDLESAAKALEEKINMAGFPLLVQKRNTPTYSLCEEFRAVRESVLFGVDTFWYGVDFKGDTLTQVIITRIPFPNPTDPIQMARKKLLERDEYEKRYFYDAIIKLKQGIGRLIRSETDKGNVIVLDSRYKTFVRDRAILPTGQAKVAIAMVEQEPVADPSDTSLSIFPPSEQYDDKESSIIESFIRDSCVLGPGYSERGRELHHAYRRWHIKNNIRRRLARAALWAELSNFPGVMKISPNPAYFAGICLKENAGNRITEFSSISGRNDSNNASIDELRAKALEIGETGEGRESLIQMFTNSDYEVRRRACSAAKKLSDRNIVKHIVPCLYASEPQVRQYALGAVFSSKCIEVVPHVKKIMREEDKDYNRELCRNILMMCERW